MGREGQLHLIWLQSKAGQILAAIVAGAAFIAALMSKAKRDAESDIKAKSAETRLQTREDTQERSDEIASLDDRARAERFNSLWDGNDSD